MAERIDQHEEAHRLAAFADGELSGADAAAMQARLAIDPAAAARVAAARRMREGIAAAFLATAPRPSEGLRQRIAAISLQSEHAVTLDGAPVLAQRSGGARWLLAVAAVALLAIGVVAGRLLFGPTQAANSSPVPASMVAAVTHVHVFCSRAPDLHVAGFPKQLGKLEGPLERYLGRPVPYPDLRPIGYQYVGACPAPEVSEPTVHLLYHATGTPITDTVSLFVQSYHGQVHVEDGKVYWAAGKGAAHPMIVWRKDEMVFYLVGDADQPVIGAADLMHVHVPL